MKIVVVTVLGVLFLAPLFVLGDEDTNTPVATVPAAVPVTNQPTQVAPADDSIDSMRKKAGAGDKESQFALGISYQYGLGVEKDPTEAAKWYRKAADQGHSNAQFYLGVAYAHGDGVEQDLTKAVDWYRKAAEQGCAQAQYNLGGCYFHGYGVDKDPVESAKWDRKAAEQGFAPAQFQIGGAYYTGYGVKKDVVEAVNWFRRAADQGNAMAQWSLGSCYYNGIGVKKDAVEEVSWDRKAAEQGYVMAQRDLAISYAKGEGVDKNPEESSKWMLKAAEQGDSTSQDLAGLMYMEGTGVIKNEVEGMAWLYVATANGNVAASKNISYFESHYAEDVVLAARTRASAIQTQIASHATPTTDDSTAAITQPVRVPNAPKESGSGAIISADGLVLTAAHVIRGASRIEVVTATGALAAAVVKIDATNDVALLKCTGSNFTPLPIALSKEARAGTTVFTIGFPNIQLQGFDPKLTKGEISSETGFQDDPRQWQISVPIQPGNSGGPLCDENGNLIGLVEATLNPLTTAKVAGEIPQNVNYAVKSSYILPLLDDVKNLPPAVVSPAGAKFEDVVGNVQKSAVLILVY